MFAANILRTTKPGEGASLATQSVENDDLTDIECDQKPAKRVCLPKELSISTASSSSGVPATRPSSLHSAMYDAGLPSSSSSSSSQDVQSQSSSGLRLPQSAASQVVLAPAQVTNDHIDRVILHLTQEPTFSILEFLAPTLERRSFGPCVWKCGQRIVGNT